MGYGRWLWQSCWVFKNALLRCWGSSNVISFLVAPMYQIISADDQSPSHQNLTATRKVLHNGSTAAVVTWEFDVPTSIRFTKPLARSSSSWFPLWESKSKVTTYCICVLVVAELLGLQESFTQTFWAFSCHLSHQSPVATSKSSLSSPLQPIH